MSKRAPHVITCKAAVVMGKGQPLKVEEVQIEPPKSCEVRMKMLYASVCHTDVLRANGFPAPLFPRVLGHEGVGLVESVGDQVEGIEEGDLVIPTFVAECQHCENCRSPDSNMCMTYPTSWSGLTPDGTSRMSIQGQQLYHMFSCSTWTEYAVVHSSFVVKIDPSIPLPHASVLSCGFSTGFGVAWKEAEVKPGSSVAIFGLGAVGLGAVEGARLLGASKIIGVDKNSMKKAKGEALGMTNFINSDEIEKPVSQAIQDLTDGIGVDYCFECSGTGPLINEALKATKWGRGKVVFVGSKSQQLNIDFYPLLSGRTLKGSVFGGIKVKSELPIIFERCKNKDFHLDDLLTYEVSLQDIHKAFELLRQPDCVKVLIKI